MNPAQIYFLIFVKKFSIRLQIAGKLQTRKKNPKQPTLKPVQEVRFTFSSSPALEGWLTFSLLSSQLPFFSQSMTQNTFYLHSSWFLLLAPLLYFQMDLRAICPAVSGGASLMGFSIAEGPEIRGEPRDPRFAGWGHGWLPMKYLKREQAATRCMRGICDRM